MEVEGGGGGGGGGGGCPPGVSCKERIAGDPTLGFRGQLRQAGELDQLVQEAQSNGDTTPPGLLRMMRPRSSVGRDSEPDADAESEPDKDTPRQSSISADQVVLTSDKGHESKSPSPAAVDLVYEQNKADVDDPKDEVRQAGPGNPPVYAYQHFRTFVHGLEYIDELVLMYDNWAFYHPLQDANYNVMAIEGSGLLFRYDPYGRMHIRDQYNVNAPWIAHEYNPEAATPFYDLPGFQGRMQDRETGVYNFRNRDLALPPVGRWLQADPNGTGLVLIGALRYHGQAPAVYTMVGISQQQRDGMNPYSFVRSNPVIGLDPSGLLGLLGFNSSAESNLDWMSETQDMEDDLIGHKLYVLGTLNEGARWASLGLQVAADIGTSLLPGYGVYQAYQSLELIAHGGGGFWDYMSTGFDVISAAAPLIKVTGIFTKGALWAGRAKTLAADARKFKNFEERYFRHNLKALTGIDPGRYVHAHHVIPKQWAHLLPPGMNVNDPKYGAWWAGAEHLAAHGAGYNKRWKDFLTKKPTENQILQFGRDLAKEYGFEVGF